MTTIGIIGAMDEEVKKFIELFKMEKEKDIRDIYVSNSKDKKIVVARSGIGKVNSAALTQYLIDKYKVDLIINSGCAGSLVDTVKLMDVVIGTEVTYHDFSPIRIMNMALPTGGPVKSSTTLINKAKEAMESLNNFHYHEGLIVSGDCFVTNDEMRNEIRISTGGLAVDMESASIGHIAALNQIPFISIRTISDFADGIDNFEELASYKSSHLVKVMVDNL